MKVLFNINITSYNIQLPKNQGVICMIQEKTGKILKRVQELSNAILELKEGVADDIKSLPENSDIQVINKQCFIIPLSRLSGDLCLSPEYYRFSFQYQALADMILRSKAENVLRKLRETLTEGWVYLSSERSRRVRLHPDVIKNVKSII